MPHPGSFDVAGVQVLSDHIKEVFQATKVLSDHIFSP